MDRHDIREKNTAKKERRITVISITGLFSAIGAVLGIIAYYRQWLG